MAYQKPQIKTDAEWKEINFKNSLGPQIGGLIHDAVALAITEHKLYQSIEDKIKVVKTIKPERIREILDMLYDLAEQKKSQILKDQEPKPLTSKDIDNAEKMGAKVLENETQEQGAGIDAVNDELNKEAAENKQIPF